MLEDFAFLFPGHDVLRFLVLCMEGPHESERMFVVDDDWFYEPCLCRTMDRGGIVFGFCILYSLKGIVVFVALVLCIEYLLEGR